jgi:hypothetical protein
MLCLSAAGQVTIFLRQCTAEPAGPDGGHPAKSMIKVSSPAARHQTGRRVPGPDRRAGVRRSVWQARRDAGPGDTRRATGAVPPAPCPARWWRACSRASQLAASSRVSFAGDLRRPGGAWHGWPDLLHGRNRHIQMDLAEPCRWGVTSLTRRPAPQQEESRFAWSGVLCTDFSLEPQPARLPPSSAWTTDPNWRAMVFAAAAAVLCCCTRPWNRGLGISNYAFDLGGAMGIRTPDLLHAMQWQHVHGSASVQVTVSGRPHESPWNPGRLLYFRAVPSRASTGSAS